MDLYHKWLAIPEGPRPPSHYQLLGVAPDEDDPEVIEEAAIRQASHVRTYQTGPDGASCTRLLNEIAEARNTLLSPAKRRAYDRRLGLDEPGSGPEAAPVATAVVPAGMDFGAETTAANGALVTPHVKPARPWADAVGRTFVPLLLAALVFGLWTWPLPFEAVSPHRERPATVAPPGPAPAADAAGELRRLEGHRTPVRCVAFSPDGRWAVSGSGDATGHDCTVRLWHWQTGRELRRFARHTAPVHAVTFSPDGRLVLSGAGAYEPRGWRTVATDCTARLWDVASGEELHCFDGHEAPVRGVAFSPDGRHAITCGEDMTLRTWDVATGRLVRVSDLERAPFLAMALAPDGERVLTGNAEGLLQLWEERAWREVRHFGAGGGAVRSLAFAPDGRTALAGEAGAGGLRLWDVASGTEVRRFAAGGGTVEAVALSPDGRLALSGGSDRVVRLWDVETGRAIRTFEGHVAGVTGVAFSPDGRRGLSGGLDRSVRVWDLDGEPAR